MRVLALLSQILRTARRDDSGQSLIVIVSAMTVLLGLAAFGIDTAQWMVRHHNAQVVADSAALAAAQCLANPTQPATIDVGGTTQTLTACGTGANADAHAQDVAVAYAAANGVTIQPSNVTFNGKVVTVTASTSTPGGFAQIMGIKSTSQSAQAGAGWTASGQCTTAGQNCDFMYANSSACSSTSATLNTATQGNSTINGNIQTNGYLYADGTGNAGGINGTGNYGSQCTDNNSWGGNHDPWQSGNPTPASSVLTWPIDYSKDFPACGPGTGNACVNGYPAYCTNTGANITLNDSIPADKASPGLIYCASGTSTTPNDPSTYNGSITITMSGSNTIEDSFVAGTITYSGAGSDNITACGWTASGYSAATCDNAPAPATTPNYPIFYVVGADPNASSCAAGTSPATSCAFYMHSNGNFSLYGDMFVQNGTASFDFHGNQSAANTFIEANSIDATLDGNFSGDGPPVTGANGTGQSGGVSLVQ